MAGTVTAHAIRLLDCQLQDLEEHALARRRQSSVSFLLRWYMCLVSLFAVFQCLL
jgi:predicted ABC-type transport system involved in lysophospholipase L1 biosynthesis ATPase subunit